MHQLSCLCLSSDPPTWTREHIRYTLDIHTSSLSIPCVIQCFAIQFAHSVVSIRLNSNYVYKLQTYSGGNSSIPLSEWEGVTVNGGNYTVPSDCTDDSDSDDADTDSDDLARKLNMGVVGVLVVAAGLLR